MNFIDIILDTIHDTWAMLPLLYITYCILEVFERKNTQDDKLFFGLQRLGPILGALVGLIPQCGFSILAAMLFVQNNITLGTLVSVMIATSDEAIPILISNPKMYSSLLGILGLKLVIAIVVGLFTDHVLFRNQKILRFEDMEEEDYDDEEYEEEESSGSSCPCCYPEYPLWISALLRSLKIYVFIFITSFVLTLLMELIGEKTLSMILLHTTLYSWRIVIWILTCRTYHKCRTRFNRDDSLRSKKERYFKNHFHPIYNRCYRRHWIYVIVATIVAIFFIFAGKSRFQNVQCHTKTKE